MENKLDVRYLNSFLAEVEVDGRKIILVDHEAEEAAKQSEVVTKKSNKANIHKVCRIVGNIAYIAGLLLCMYGFLYIIGTAGHMDYCDEFKIHDDWSTLTYLLRAFNGFILMALGAFAGKVGLSFKKLHTVK